MLSSRTLWLWRQEENEEEPPNPLVRRPSYEALRLNPQKRKWMLLNYLYPQRSKKRKAVIISDASSGSARTEEDEESLKARFRHFFCVHASSFWVSSFLVSNPLLFPLRHPRLDCSAVITSQSRITNEQMITYGDMVLLSAFFNIFFFFGIFFYCMLYNQLRYMTYVSWPVAARSHYKLTRWTICEGSYSSVSSLLILQATTQRRFAQQQHHSFCCWVFSWRQSWVFCSSQQPMVKAKKSRDSGRIFLTALLASISVGLPSPRVEHNFQIWVRGHRRTVNIFVRSD